MPVTSGYNQKIVLFDEAVAGAKRLVELEAQIQRDGEAIGRALLEIRNGRLYRLTHSNFEAYLKERWGYCRSHGYRIINHAIELQTSPIGDRPACEWETRQKRSERRKGQDKPADPEISEARDPELTDHAAVALTTMGVRKAKAWVDAA